MNRTHAAREAWHPQSREDREAIFRELEEVISSPHFSNSKRYPALLKYIVDNTLAGRTDLLKERTLGVEVFQRPATYDTNTDTVVRYTAGEVRKRLLLYYSEHESQAGVQISLPAGSYVPEFLRESGDEGAGKGDASGPGSVHLDHGGAEAHNHARNSPAVVEPWPAHISEVVPSPTVAGKGRRGWAMALVVCLLLLIVAGIAAWWGTARREQPVNSVNDFWAPVLRDQRPIVICAGSVVFAQNNYSGVVTAGGNTDYPFFSIQTTSAITGLTGVLERGGATTQLLSAPSTQLTQLREHSIALLGAYNNQWTLRLMEPLRYHFLPDPAARIVDTMHPGAGWERDESQPYSSADDYAVVARFRDSRIDGWVVAMAGIGRNGTEAAAQFATSQHYLELLRQRLGSFGNKSIEVVLKVGVVKGETGAPTILTAYAW